MTLPHEEALDEVRATASRAASLGIRTELLRVTTRHPVRALLQIVVERDAGLLVFGPDRRRLRGLRFRAAARRVRAGRPVPRLGRTRRVSARPVAVDSDRRLRYETRSAVVNELVQ